jgi:hypothetical protein
MTSFAAMALELEYGVLVGPTGEASFRRVPSLRVVVPGAGARSRSSAISAQFFGEQHGTPGCHPSDRHEAPASPNTCITLLT